MFLSGLTAPARYAGCTARPAGPEVRSHKQCLKCRPWGRPSPQKSTNNYVFDSTITFCVLVSFENDQTILRNCLT